MDGRFGWFKRAMVRRALASEHARRAMSRDPAHKLWAWLWADRDIVLDAVRHHGCHLQYASTELRADRVVVLTAVMQAGSALKYASAELRADLEVVLVAMEHSWPTLCVPAELQADPEVTEQVRLMQYSRRQIMFGYGMKQGAGVWTATWPRVYVAMKFSLMRDRDALGAAVGVRTLPAPHATLNGAPEALSIVHCLIARRVQAMSPELTRQTFRHGLFYIHWNPKLKRKPRPLEVYDERTPGRRRGGGRRLTYA